MHDDISQVLLLNTLSSAPDSGIVDVLHLRDLYEAKSCHVVIQSFSFRNGQAHLMDDGINLSVAFNLVFSLEINGSVCWRALFNADRLVNGQIFLLNVSQSVSVAGKADSHKLTFAILTSHIVQIVAHVVAKETDYLGCEIIAIEKVVLYEKIIGEDPVRENEAGFFCSFDRTSNNYHSYNIGQRA